MHVAAPAHPDSVIAAGFGSFRLDRPDALPHVIRIPAIGEQDTVEPGSDRPLSQKAPGFLVQLDHGGKPHQLRRPAYVFQGEEVEWSVLGDEFDVVEDARMADDLHYRRPRALDVGPDRGPPGLQRLSQLVPLHLLVVSCQPVRPSSGQSTMTGPQRSVVPGDTDCQVCTCGKDRPERRDGNDGPQGVNEEVRRRISPVDFAPHRRQAP